MDLEAAVLAVKEKLKDPKNVKEEQEVLDKFQHLFKYDNIDNISKAQFQSFLDVKENRHWTLQRLKTTVTQDMSKLKAALRILLDNSLPIEDRLRKLRDRSSPEYIDFMGKAVFSPILLVTNPSNYPVFNGTVERAFKKLGIHLENESQPIWKLYPEVQDLIKRMASRYGLSLWQMDWVWWEVVNHASHISYAELIEYLNKYPMNENYKPVVIKTLIDKQGYRASRQNLEQELYSYNPGRIRRHMTTTVLSVLKDNNIIRKEQDEYVLNLAESLTAEETDKLRSLCDKKINEFGFREDQQRFQGSNLEDLILAFDKDRNAFDSSRISEEEAMKLQSQFISDFPPDKISDMTLDDYAIGKTDPNSGETDYGTFCYRLEFGIQGFGGIRGTPANKFGIYRNKKTQEFVYNKSKFESPETAYNTIKSEILLILHAGKEFTQDMDWMALAQTLESEFNILRHVRSKILSVYYPNEFLQMHSNSDAERILISLFGLTREQIPKGLFLKQAKLLELKNAHPVMKNWSNIAYSDFIWDATTPKESDEARTYDEESVWLVRAGRKGEGEQLALDRNMVGIGYGGFDRSINDFKTFKQQFITLHPDQKTGSINRVIPQIWDFLHNVKIGDFVMLPLLAQDSMLIAVGRIEGDCQDGKLHSEMTVSRPVKWLKKDVPKSAFDYDLVKSLGFRGTVYHLGGSAMIQKLRGTLKKAGVTEVMFEQNMDSGISKIEQVNARIPTTIDELAKTTYLSIELLTEIEALISEKRQVIFYGPPGTSKTYVARKLSEYFTQKTDNIELIQFHQSYSYEDFVEGIKPIISSTAGIEFSRQPGLFKNLVTRCITKPQERFVLIIDEINRGNISKIIGELIYLLEYRNEAISLTYSPGEKFSIPSNLYIIGTMNSADRSIAFVDYALRRRFYFIDFYPDSDGRILYGWFKDNSIKLDASSILDMLNQINRKIRDQLGKEYQIGHSYFMVKDLSYDKLKMIIKYAIIPLLEQYYFGKEKSVREIMEICNKVLFSSHSNIGSLTSE